LAEAHSKGTTPEPTNRPPKKGKPTKRPKPPISPLSNFPTLPAANGRKPGFAILAERRAGPGLGRALAGFVGAGAGPEPGRGSAKARARRFPEYRDGRKGLASLKTQGNGLAGDFPKSALFLPNPPALRSGFYNCKTVFGKWEGHPLTPFSSSSVPIFIFNLRPTTPEKIMLPKPLVTK